MRGTVQLAVNVLPIINVRKLSAIAINNIFEHAAKALPPARPAAFLDETISASLQPIQNCLNLRLRIRRKDLADPFSFGNRIAFVAVFFVLLLDICAKGYRFKEGFDV